MPCDGKRSEKIGIWVTERLMLDLTKLANAEDLSLSAYLERELRRHAYGHAPAVVNSTQGADRTDSGGKTMSAGARPGTTLEQIEAQFHRLTGLGLFHFPAWYADQLRALKASSPRLPSSREAIERALLRVLRGLEGPQP